MKRKEDDYFSRREEKAKSKRKAKPKSPNCPKCNGNLAENGQCNICVTTPRHGPATPRRQDDIESSPQAGPSGMVSSHNC